MGGPVLHNRRSIRLHGYNYADEGVYFITACAKDRECMFGEVATGHLALNRTGWAVKRYWRDIPRHFPGVMVNAFVVMPNHVHGIVIITKRSPNARRRGDACVAPTTADGTRVAPSADRRPHGTPAGSLGAIVGSFKSAVTKMVNARRGTPGAKVWQRNYYEHVIRNFADWQRIADYIALNPTRWIDDIENNPACPMDDETWDCLTWAEYDQLSQKG